MSKVLIDADELTRLIDNLEEALKTIRYYEDDVRLVAQFRNLIKSAAITGDIASELDQLRAENAKLKQEAENDAELIDAMQRALAGDK